MTTRETWSGNALRMRPDRIIIGECRGGETLDMLQAMNTGHAGSLTTVHANDSRDALGRLEVMVGMAGVEMPMWVIRRQIASAIHVVVQVSRVLGGACKVIKITEVVGMEGENLTTHDLFLFKQTGVDRDPGAPRAYFHTTGVRPHYLDRLTAVGLGLPVEVFGTGACSVRRGRRRRIVSLVFPPCLPGRQAWGILAGAFVWSE